MVSGPKSYLEFRETGPRGKVLSLSQSDSIFNHQYPPVLLRDCTENSQPLHNAKLIINVFFGKSLEENKELKHFCSQLIKLINSILSTVDGGWGPWVEWSVCSSSCGLGTQTRFRYCDNPRLAFGGRACTGPRLDRRNCNRGSCPGIVYSSFIADF